MTVFVKCVIALVLVLTAGPAVANGNNNNGNGDDVTCTDYLGQSVSVVDLCINKVNADAEAYCGSYCQAGAEAKALAICGDCAQFCEGGTAFALAKVKQSCDQSVGLSAYTSVKCGYASQSCGDTSLECSATTATCDQMTTNTNTLECPDVDVDVVGNILRCAKVKTLKSGAIRGKHCFVVIEANE